MSRTLLHLDSSILGASSASRLLSSHVVDQLSQKLPAVRVTYRDLAAQPIPHLSGPYVAATRGNLAMPLDATLRDDLALGEAVLQEFLAADIVVIGVATIFRLPASSRPGSIASPSPDGRSAIRNPVPKACQATSMCSWPLRVAVSMERDRRVTPWSMRKRICEVRSPSSASRSSTSFRRKGSTWVTPRTEA